MGKKKAQRAVPLDYYLLFIRVAIISSLASPLLPRPQWFY
jgi:hypothetical protein